MAADPIYSKISEQLQLSIKQIATVSALLDEGATIPFLARYRKEVRGLRRRTTTRYSGSIRTSTNFRSP
jgi:transcriptional accessory protein Tex/SPT6